MPENLDPNRTVDDAPRDPLAAGLAAAFGPDSGPPLPAAGSVVRALGAPVVQLRDVPTDPPSSVNRPASPEMPPASDPAARLQLLGEIARGGMGAVLKGRDADLGRDVAVKVLLEAHAGRTELVQRFVEEAQVAGQLQHPGVVPVYELGQFPDKRPYFTMKLVKGQTLAKLLAERPDPSRERPRFLKVFEQVCQAMAYAHARGVIHRDLKPSNVMLGAFGEVQVMDWGLAKVLKEGGVADEKKAQQEVSVIRTARSEPGTPVGSHTAAGQVMGTPAYMAPEQARGEVERLDARCDVFGLGAVLCVILTGQPPYTGSGDEVYRKAERGDLADALARLGRCGADAELIDLAKRCLAVERDGRPRDAGAVATELAAYLNSVAERLRRMELERSAAEVRTAEERRRRRVQLALAVAVLFAVSLGGGAWYLRQHEREERQAALRAKIDQALQDGQRAWGQARAAAPGNGPAWQEAREALERAEALAQAPEAGTPMRGRVREVRDQFEQEHAASRAAAEREEQDRQMLARLERVRLAKARVRNGEFDTSAADPAYAEAFRAYGVDLDRVQPHEAAARLRARAKGSELATYLDDWAWVRRNRKGKEDRSWEPLSAVARALDADPWRNRLRDALAWGDKQALKALARSADADALPPATLSLLGTILADTGEVREAVALLRRAVRRHSADFWLNHELASALGRLQPPQAEEALRHHAIAVALHPESPGAWFTLGTMLSAQFAREQAKRSPPQEFGLLMNEDKVLGNVEWLREYIRLLDEAQAALEKAVKLQPDFADAHTALGDVLRMRYQDGEWLSGFWESLRSPLYRDLFDKRALDKALASYDRCLALRPTDAYSHFQKGKTFIEKEGWDQALQAFMEAARCDASFLVLTIESFAVTLRMKYEASKYDRHKVVAACREAARQNPNDADSHFFLGLALHLKGKLESAEVAFRRALDVRDDPVVRRCLALVLLTRAGKSWMALLLPDIPPLGEGFDGTKDLVRTDKSVGALRAEAVSQCREAIRLFPELSEAHLLLGLLLLRTDRIEDGVAALQEGLRHPHLEAMGRLSPAEGIFSGLYRVLRWDTGMMLLPDVPVRDPDLAVRVGDLRRVNLRRSRESTVVTCRELVAMRPVDANAHLSLSEALAKADQVDEALVACHEAIRLAPSDAAGYFLLGELLRKAGRYDESLLAYQRGHRLIISNAPPSFVAASAWAAGWEMALSHPVSGMAVLVSPSRDYGILEKRRSAGRVFSGEMRSPGEWVEDAKRRADRDRRLTAVLGGEAKPSGEQERLDLARHAHEKQVYRAAVRLYAEAFAARREPERDLDSVHRYNAACAAALAASGVGGDALVFESPERARLRRQALDWLRADLALLTRELDAGGGKVFPLVRQKMVHWLQDGDLIGLRDKDALAVLPEEEREACAKLWADVAALLRKAEAK